MTCRLYRHFDGAGRLLYVGISLNIANRLIQHMIGSPWADEIRNVTVEVFDTRDDAIRAERDAIDREGPLHNKILYKSGRVRLPFPPEFDRARYDEVGQPEIAARVPDAEGVKHTFQFTGGDDGMVYITPQGKKPIAVDQATLGRISSMATKAKEWLNLYKEMHPDHGRNDFEL